MTLATTRISKETQRLLSEPVEGVVATPYEENPRYFNVVLAGPIESPYTGNDSPSLSGISLYAPFAKCLSYLLSPYIL